MIAYNRQWLNNQYIREEAEEAVREECMDQNTFDAVCEKHPVKFYTPNFFVRVGLAILTLVIVVFSTALIMLMGGGGSTWAYLLLFMGVCCYVMTEVMVRSKSHYNSGVDNILVWSAGILIWSFFFAEIEFEPTWFGDTRRGMSHSEVIVCIIGVVISGILALRFVDVLLTVAGLVFLAFCFVFWSSDSQSALTKAMIPFVSIATFGAIYSFFRRMKKAAGKPLYRHCLLWGSIAALILMYASGNYYVIKELNSSSDPTVQTEMPLFMKAFFWTWTFVVPVACFYFAIRKRDVALLRVGLPLIAAAILTFRYYYHVIPPETAMMLAGAILFIISYSLINYLKQPRGGFTFEPERHQKNTPDAIKIITGELVHAAGESGGAPKEKSWGD